ncbi:MAG: winged helix-turn-helix domain-containing protein [Thaumarchaeota archaeon]|nr:winged helix-turn-helix domain-containing protein [Nitrososphaerota archaeon]
MRAFKYIRDPRAFEAVADETRRKMIYLLRAKEMTVSQLAESLDKTPQAIYHQIKKLTEVGLVEVAREERVDHFIETYFRASAEVFEFHHGNAGSTGTNKHMKEAFEALEKIGISPRNDEESIRAVAKAEEKMNKIGLPQELEDKIAQLDEVGFLTKSKVYHLAQFALMSDKEFDELIAAEKTLRGLMTSKVAKRQGPA